MEVEIETVRLISEYWGSHEKHIHREVQFDALNMRTSRDIKCKGRC